MTREEKQEQKFNEFYKHLLKYKKEFGECNAISTYICKDGYLLGARISYYREGYKKYILKQNIKSGGIITPKQIEKLLDIGFRFDGLENRQNIIFDTFYEHLKDYKNIFGDCEIPSNYICNDGYKLGSKTRSIRLSYKKYILNENKKASLTITKEQVHKLEKIGFIFNAVQNKCEKKFNTFLQRFLKYKKEKRTPFVSSSYIEKDGYRLGKIADEYRQAYQYYNSLSNKSSTVRITERQITKLKNVGFLFTPLDERFNIFYSELINFKKKYHHLYIPHRYKTENGYLLGRQVDNYRQAYKKIFLGFSEMKNTYIITDDQLQKLKSIGFIFTLTPEEKRLSKKLIIPQKGYIYGVFQKSLKKYVYVGQTINFSQRKNKHYNLGSGNEKNKKLYKMMDKYGVDDFEIKLLETCKFSEIDMREAYWTDKLNTIKNGYQKVAPKVIY